MSTGFIKMDLPKITSAKKLPKVPANNRKPRLTTCQICGKPFMADQPNKRYCSTECATAAKQIKRKRWEKAHRNDAV